jgi:hypothetical protein
MRGQRSIGDGIAAVFSPEFRGASKTASASRSRSESNRSMRVTRPSAPKTMRMRVRPPPPTLRARVGAAVGGASERCDEPQDAVPEPLAGPERGDGG